MTKREFLATATLGLGLAAVPGLARAQRFRILGEAPGADDSAVGGASSPEWERLARGARIGSLRWHGPLRVFWLHADRLPTPHTASPDPGGHDALRLVPLNRVGNLSR